MLLSSPHERLAISETLHWWPCSVSAPIPVILPWQMDVVVLMGCAFVTQSPVSRWHKCVTAGSAIDDFGRRMALSWLARTEEGNFAVQWSFPGCHSRMSSVSPVPALRWTPAGRCCCSPRVGVRGRSTCSPWSGSWRWRRPSSSSSTRTRVEIGGFSASPPGSTLSRTGAAATQARHSLVWLKVSGGTACCGRGLGRRTNQFPVGEPHGIHLILAIYF